MTSKPISTISYNSEAFLKEKLDKWVKAHKIQTYMYICHVGEDGDKDHIHVRIEPNMKIDPMDLSDELQETDPNHEKPLGCRPFRPSNEEDWFLYVVHDKEYLKLKYKGGEKGEKLPYDWRSIVTPDSYDVEVAMIRARAHLEHTTSKMIQRLAKGECTPLDLVAEGENVFQVNAVRNTLCRNDYERLLSEYDYYYAECDKLRKAIDAKNLCILVSEDGSYLLEQNSPHE